MLSGSSVNFTWSHETNAVSYELAGSPPAGRPRVGHYAQPQYHGQRSADRWQLHLCHARRLNRRHQLHGAGSGLYVAYGPIAVMINPLPNTMFAGPSVTFNWVRERVRRLTGSMWAAHRAATTTTNPETLAAH